MSAAQASANAYAVVAIGGFAAGAVQTGTLKGAVTGAISAGVFYGVGNAFLPSNAEWAYRNSEMTFAGHAAKALADGAAGGVMEQLQGGSFGHGFASAGFGSAFSPAPDAYESFRVTAAKTMQAAVIGGTASALAGGKFANGAVTGSFGYAFGSVASRTAMNRRMANAAAFDYETAMAFESSPYLRATVPGQVAWDNAVTSWEEGSYGYAALHATAMLGEQVLYAATLGQSFAVNGVKNYGYVTVSRWGRPGLEAGDWVMKGEAGWCNYLCSGKWQPGFTNEFAPFSSGVEYIVPKSHLALPRGWGIDGWIKAPFGQRIYMPPSGGG
jgi:hypothetical protein